MIKKNIIFSLIVGALLIGYQNYSLVWTANYPQQDDEDKKLLSEFNAPEKSGKKIALNWNGTWTVPSRHYGADLIIKKATATKFEFVLSALNGANVGEISGTARIKGGKALFDDAKNKKDGDEPNNCKLLFVHRSNLIEVSQTSGCDAYGGVGVHFAGEYRKGKQPVKERSFDAEVFPNPNLERKFKTLVGKDFENFLDAFHLIYTDQDKDLDNFGAKVVSGCVRGICPNMAGIIMYDERERIWTAVMIDGGDKIHYYASDAAWTNKLPETIKNWLEEKGSTAPIVYRSRQNK